MRLSLASWSLPQCTIDECAAISKALGINALDVGLFYRSALNKAEILADPTAAAGRLGGLGVDIPNYYHLFGDNLASRNLALAGTVSQNVRDIEAVLQFADAAKITTVFVLPGIINPGQSRQQALDVSIESLNELMAVSQDFRAKLCIEPHVHSFAESPDIALKLVDATGVGLVLDYCHFTCLGYRQEEIEPLAKHAVHVHLRQARSGMLQTKFAQGTLNFPAIFATLRDADYDGWLTLESVHQDYMNTLSDDVLTETILMRDCFIDWVRG